MSEATRRNMNRWMRRALKNARAQQKFDEVFEILEESGLDSTEIALLNGITAGTAAASKALVLGSSSEIDSLGNVTAIGKPAAAAAEHGDGAIGTGVAPATYRYTRDGVIITEIQIDLTGLDSSGVANDVIGLADPGTDAAYIGRNVVATNGQIYRVEMSCIELPLTGDADVILVQGSAADETFDDTVADTAVLCDGTGDWVLGETIVNNAPAVSANYYYYLTQGASDNAAYTAGQFIIRTYGHALLA